MKKLTAFLVCLFLFTSFGTAAAAFDFDDPALCVNGQWLLVDAAKVSAVHVIVPHGTHFGDKKQGGCKTDSPAPLLPRGNVVVLGGSEKMVVVVNGAQASKPVEVSYDGRTKTAKNTNGGLLWFVFDLDK